QRTIFSMLVKTPNPIPINKPIEPETSATSKLDILYPRRELDRPALIQNEQADLLKSARSDYQRSQRLQSRLRRRLRRSAWSRSRGRRHRQQERLAGRQIHHLLVRRQLLNISVSQQIRVVRQRVVDQRQRLRFSLGLNEARIGRALGRDHGRVRLALGHLPGLLRLLLLLLNHINRLLRLLLGNLLLLHRRRVLVTKMNIAQNKIHQDQIIIGQL